MVNYIKARPVKTILFSDLCSAMDSEYTQLLIHIEVRWLSRGPVLPRFYAIKEQPLFFLSEESEYADFLRGVSWCNKFSFLADIFQTLNVLNKGMQGKNENILTSIDKMCLFKDKLSLWEDRIRKKNVKCLSLPTALKLTHTSQH